MPRPLLALAGALCLLGMPAQGWAMPAWDTTFASSERCAGAESCGPDAADRPASRCGISRSGLAIAVRATVETPQPTCDQARALADAALRGRFRWAVVSDRRWWTRGVSTGDAHGWTASYHHYAFDTVPTRVWTIRLRVIWRWSQTELPGR